MNQVPVPSTPPRRKLLTIRNAAKLLMACGLGFFLLAVGWWFVFFEQMLGEDVKAASACFYSTTAQCEVGNFVGLFMDTPAYEPALLWASIVVIVIGLLVYVSTPKPPQV